MSSSTYLVTIVVRVDTSQEEKARGYGEYICDHIRELKLLNGSHAAIDADVAEVEEDDSWGVDDNPDRRLMDSAA